MPARGCPRIQASWHPSKSGNAMGEHSREPRARSFKPLTHDRVRHFAKDKPGWKLSALLIEKLPAILAAGTGLAMVVTALIKQWS